MARMIPESPAHDSSDAENWLFQRLKRLPGNAVVLHSLGLAHHQQKRWSEIDFTIVCRWGIFLIEVKGGAVHRRAGKWFVTDRLGRTSSLGQGPFAQVGGAEAATRRFLIDRIPRLENVTMGYGVVTPDCRLDVDDLGTNRGILFDSRDLDLSPSAIIERLMFEWRTRMRDAANDLDDDLISEVVEHLCADVPAVPSIRRLVMDANEQIHAATLEQERILIDLAFRDRIVVDGPAGSGKSTIALGECLRRASAGQRVLFLCNTDELAHNLRGPLGRQERLEITSVGSASLPSRPAGSVDVLVIDEAQDVLPQIDISELGRCLVGGVAAGVWRVMFDGYQRSGSSAAKSSEVEFLSHAMSTAKLSKNVRNSVEIATLSSALGYVDRIEGGIHGPPPQLKFLPAGSEVAAVVESVESWLDQGLERDEIRVLVPSALARGGSKEGGFFGTLDVSLKTAGVALCSIEEMQGRESIAVIVVGIDELRSTESRRLAYLACTRAQVFLHVVLPESMQPIVDGAYADLLLRNLRAG